MFWVKKKRNICHAYLDEIVIHSDGNVTPCCLDAKGQNVFGNINDTSLQEIWTERILPWHELNIAASKKCRPWKYDLCNICFEYKAMTRFKAVHTSDKEMLQRFYVKNHTLPKSLVIEPSSSCTFSCWGCYIGLQQLNRTEKLLDYEKFRTRILPAIPFFQQVRLFNYGEPFLQPRIADMITSLRSVNPRLQIVIGSNGMFMTEDISEVLVREHVNYMMVTIHGGHTQEGLLKYARRGPNIETIAQNIRNLVSIKKKNNSKLPWIFLKAHLFNWNDSEKEMEEYLEFGKNLGVDLAGWDLNKADAQYSSKRAVPGSHAYEELEKRRLLIHHFFRFPAWPDIA